MKPVPRSEEPVREHLPSSADLLQLEDTPGRSLDPGSRNVNHHGGTGRAEHTGLHGATEARRTHGGRLHVNAGSAVITPVTPASAGAWIERGPTRKPLRCSKNGL